MSTSDHFLILARRDDLLEKLYAAAWPSGASFTIAPDVRAFLDFATRFRYRGAVIHEAAAPGTGQWNALSAFLERHPNGFVGMLPSAPEDEAFRRWPDGQGGWTAVHPPYPPEPVARLAERLKTTTAAWFESMERTGADALLAAIRDKSSETFALDALTAPSSSARIFAVHTRSPSDVDPADVAKAFASSPDRRVLFLFDASAEAAASEAVRAGGWFVMPHAGAAAFLSGRLRAASGDALPPAAAESVLVVDDEPNLLAFAMDILEEAGYKVTGAASGREAMDAVRAQAFDAALVDYQLGDTTGVDLAKEIRAVSNDIPVLIMTAHASLDNAVRAIQADVYDFLIKPLDTRHLRRSLHKALEKRRADAQIRLLNAHLSRANEDLNRLGDVYPNIFSLVTHDLRTPLTSIKGYAQVLLMKAKLGDEQRRHFLTVIAKEADRLGALINDLMDFASIEANKLRIERAPLLIADLLQDAQQRLEVLAREKKIKLSVSAADDCPLVDADRRRLDQVLTNFIGNAFKHTKPGGEVVLRAEPRDNDLYVEVRDNGEGIPTEELAKIFQQFYQVEAHATKREGLGLGLAISKEIVHAHGGTIGAHSDGPGKGALFWFRIPGAERARPDRA